MTLLVSECFAHIEHALGRAVDQRLVPIRIVNTAGQWIVGVFPWTFLDRPAANLDFVAGQTYCSLPTDFGALIGVEFPSIIGTYHPSSLSEINQLRRFPYISSALAIWGAVDFSAGTVVGAPTPRLEVYPTPTSNLAAALSLVYRADWVQVASDTDHIIIPPYMEPVFIETVRAYALGWEEGENASMARRLSEVLQGPQMMGAKLFDAGQQMDYGPARGTANAMASYGYHDDAAYLSPWRLANPS